ncbi:MAG TPA: sigma-54 dependent transcriptional regulator [Opitutaceae bacterium]|nr:sigma-54 dependent transcriptional regulator [Opitutaceae bacterium]
MKLLLVGDERKNRRMVAWGFSSEPYRVKTASSRAAVGQLIEADEFQAACIDLKMQDDNAVAIIESLHVRLPQLPLIALAAADDKKLVARLKEHGVCAHLTSPFAIETLQSTLRSHALAQSIGLPKRPQKEAPAPAALPPVNPKVMNSDDTARRILELALRAANSSAAILILGETGTGKSLLAQTIHTNSPIRQKPFITVNCPCLSHELLESDLFGHVRGAFTGAVQDTWGKVAAADGGTLFLDEIGDLPMTIQPKLLRLLQEKQYERVGEAASRSANVRIIAATNRDLKREVAAGRFREDLYYRLNVIAIDVPPLRSRPPQIMAAAEAFLETVCQQLGRSSPGFTSAARRVLEGYAWPGNLRELRNVIERAAILSHGMALDAADFPALLAQPPASRYQIGGPISLHALENAHIQMVVANSSSLEEAARILQIDKSTLYRKRKAMEARVAKFDAPLQMTAAGR